MNVVIVKFRTTYNRPCRHINEDESICTYKILNINQVISTHITNHVFIIKPKIVSVVIFVRVLIYCR